MQRSNMCNSVWNSGTVPSYVFLVILSSQDAAFLFLALCIGSKRRGEELQPSYIPVSFYQTLHNGGEKKMPELRQFFKMMKGVL